MSAPPVLRDVFRALQTALGEEDDGVLFENGPGPIARLDVLIHRSPEITSFATIGMSVAELPDAPGPGGGGRAELHLARRGPLDPGAEQSVARQLANLAVHPWITGEQVNWGHLVGLDQDFPTFPGCRSVFLSGPLAPGDRDYIQTCEGPVRIINVVPVTEAEHARARAMPPIDFIQDLMTRVDVHAAR